MKKKFRIFKNKLFLIPVIVVTLLCIGITVFAFSHSSNSQISQEDLVKEEAFTPGIGAILLNDENMDIAKKRSSTRGGRVTSVSPDQIEPSIAELESSIVNEEYLQDMNAYSITHISLNDISIPKVLFANGDRVIYTKEGGDGWFLERGEELRLQYTLDLDTNEGSDKNGEIMEVGYIKDGVPTEIMVDKSIEFDVSIQSDSPGEYYFYVQNYSAGYVIIETGTIEKNR